MITNPLPLADCFDAFVIGEAEPILDQLIETLHEYAYSPRAEQLDALARIPGVFVPALGAGSGVERQWVRDIATTEAMSLVLTDETEFNQMTLIEAPTRLWSRLPILYCRLRLQAASLPAAGVAAQPGRDGP